LLEGVYKPGDCRRCRLRSGCFGYVGVAPAIHHLGDFALAAIMPRDVGLRDYSAAPPRRVHDQHAPDPFARTRLA
jgi:hypothetical protein